MNKPPGPQAAAAAAAAAPATSATEYTVRVPKASRRRFNMMRFHQSLGVDFKAWTQAKMSREDNQKEFRSWGDEMPKFGAGSEYGRDQREEARRKKYGINMRRYISENQPWLLTTGGKTDRKKFKGIREGGVSANSSWYVFMQGKDGAFEAFPVEEWYNFKMIQRYNTLTAEEAEEQFEKRDKIMNFYALKWEKKLKQEVDDPEEEKTKGKKTKSTKSLLISELDDWMSSGESEEGSDGESKPKKAKGFKKQSSKRTKKGGKKSRNDEGDSEDDCQEESDEYDEMAEHEYVSSDSSDSDCNNDEIVRKELAGCAEEDALRKLLNSDESSEDEDEKKKKEKEEKAEKEKEEKEGKGSEGEDKEKEKKKKKKKKKDKKEQKNSDGDSSSDDEKEKKKKKKPGEIGEKDDSGKRKMKNQGGDGAQNKKLKPEAAANGEGTSGAAAAASLIPPPGSESGVTEEAIRRYLMRKPMTTIELLQKFKNKKTGLNSDQLVRAIAAILKKINPVKQMVKGKMYLSIKT